MLDQINTLKDEAYQKEMSLKKTQLQYYQLQIKPHFYLNCLKNMYAMTEVGKYEDIKTSIIYLSNHLRYMLKDEFIKPIMFQMLKPCLIIFPLIFS